MVKVRVIWRADWMEMRQARKDGSPMEGSCIRYGTKIHLRD